MQSLLHSAILRPKGNCHCICHFHDLMDSFRCFNAAGSPGSCCPTHPSAVVDLVRVALQAVAMTSSMTASIGSTTTRPSLLLGVPKAAPRPARGCVTRASERPLWIPGSIPPPWLDGTLPGDFGYDPLQLGKDPETLKWYAQAELVHGRFAMLGVVGMLVPELLLPGDVEWFNAGAAPTFASTGTLFAMQVLLMGWAEIRRYQDFVKPGSVNKDPIFGASLPDGNSPGYPGGIFDPFGFFKGDQESLKLKEVKNGRLAMFATLGFYAQAVVVGKGPVACWQQHLADPWANNVWSIELAKVIH